MLPFAIEKIPQDNEDDTWNVKKDAESVKYRQENNLTKEESV